MITRSRRIQKPSSPQVTFPDIEIMPASAPTEGILLLEDGSLYRGLAESKGTAFGEVVFNTSMTGYQEILTDPSYRRQIVVMTQPHIGNYGTDPSVDESRRPWVEGFIARRFTDRVSHHDNSKGLLEYLNDHRIPSLAAIDTRALVRRLRQQGAMRGVVSSEVDDLENLRARLADVPPMQGQALVTEVTGRQETTLSPLPASPGAAAMQRCADGVHIALYDFGAKASIATCLRQRGARVTVLPADTPARRLQELGVHGVMLSNGPGDPEPLTSVIETVRQLLHGELPIFGICLGHQLLGLALGGRTYKLKFGHHGGNQPVQELATGKVSITSQNHGFAVDPDSLPSGCRVTHKNLNDGTVEGLALDGRDVYSVQYHPEAAPGPHDAYELFDRFLIRAEAQLDPGTS